MGVITYKCPNCGGGLTFNADIQKYRCEYCLSEFSQEELDEIENKELEKAEKFIFMEYFIVEEGIMWDTILEILK